MKAATGTQLMRKQIHDLRAAADIDEAEARALRVKAEEVDSDVAEARRIADEIEALLPETEDAADAA